MPLLIALALLFGWPTLVSAQPVTDIHAPPPRSTLVTIAAGSGDQGESRLLLTFAPHVPQVFILKNDSDQPVVRLVMASRGAGAAFPKGAEGLLRSLVFDQQDDGLALKFAAIKRMTVTATAVSDTVISLSFAPAGSQASTANTPAAGGLPVQAERAPGEDEFEVVPLKYADVSEVVGLLTDGLSVRSNDSFTPQEPAFGAVASGNNGGSIAPQAVAEADAANASVGESVNDTIGVDRRLNAIILKGSAEKIARLKAKIAAIDLPVRSVILETVFVELDKSGANNVGLDFNNANQQIAVATLQTGQFNAVAPASQRALSSVALQAAIYAQVSTGHGRIVSKPRISAQSGSTAKIITGDALPILTSITLSGVNGVSQQVQYVNVGVTLQIAPRVSSNGFVTSHIFCVVSSVTGSSQGYPTISQREATTSATVRDGETFVIGGLSQDSDLRQDSAVPGLGSLPLAGGLFHYRSGTKAKTELYIVVTPHIVDSTKPASGAETF